MTVYLVGAGPGDPGLLTVRGAEVLARADVVVHDRLAQPSLLELAPPSAERVDVGKRPGGPVEQEAINDLLVARGSAGLEVVRLKGGDPFVFGRGGEEALALMGAGVPFEVVPGVTSAVAAPAYAGVPVTHRGMSTSFTVLTGHSRHGADRPTDWEALGRAGGTIVVLMGVAHRAEFVPRLMAGGLAAETPVMVVRWGTRPDQRTFRTTLARLPDAELEPPVTIVIGPVAGLDLGWYDRRPLFGRTVVVTRARHQAPELVRRLEAAGAQVLVVPTIAVAGPGDGGAGMERAAAHLRSYAWVVFTSANAVDRFMPLLRDARAFGAAHVAAIGQATADALARSGVVADLVPSRASAEGLLEVFPDPPDGGGTVLLPRAAVAREVLPDGLRRRGWDVEVVEAYRTQSVTPPRSVLDQVAAADAVAFASGSSVTSFVAAAGTRSLPPVVVCIGPVTADAARQGGLPVTAVAARATVEALVDAVAGALGPVR